MRKNEKINYIIIITIIILLLSISWIFQKHLEIEFNENISTYRYTAILLDSIVIIILAVVLGIIGFINSKRITIRLLISIIIVICLFIPIMYKRISLEGIETVKYYNIFTMYELIKNN